MIMKEKRRSALEKGGKTTRNKERISCGSLNQMPNLGASGRK